MICFDMPCPLCVCLGTLDRSPLAGALSLTLSLSLSADQAPTGPENKNPTPTQPHTPKSKPQTRPKAKPQTQRSRAKNVDLEPHPTTLDPRPRAHLVWQWLLVRLAYGHQVGALGGRLSHKVKGDELKVIVDVHTLCVGVGTEGRPASAQVRGGARAGGQAGG